jgi:hypothetical protein
MTTPIPSKPSSKSRGTALALAVPLGVFGAHRFYVGKNGTGVLMALTLGGLGLWYLYDCIMIGVGEFTDIGGRPLTRWDPGLPEYGERTSAETQAELDQLRSEVAELAERVDFAERLLADPGRDARRATRDG